MSSAFDLASFSLILQFARIQELDYVSLTHLALGHDSDGLIEIMADQVNTHRDHSLPSILFETPLSARVTFKGNRSLGHETTISSKRLLQSSGE